MTALELIALSLPVYVLFVLGFCWYWARIHRGIR